MRSGEGETGQSPGTVLTFPVWTDLLMWLGLALSLMAAKVWGGWEGGTTSGHAMGTGYTGCQSFGPPDLLALQNLSTRVCVCPWEPLRAEQVWPSNTLPSFFGGKHRFSNTAPFSVCNSTPIFMSGLVQNTSPPAGIIPFYVFKGKETKGLPPSPKPSRSLNDNCLSFYLKKPQPNNCSFSK